jgi:predicted nuclease of predicted toxin-antitoxin system
VKFLLDQSAEARLGAFLVSIGHDATRVGKDHPPGLPDDQVLAIAVAENRVLLTNDSDFGEFIFKHHHPHVGVIYFRFPLDSTASQKISALEQLLSTHADNLDAYLTVTPRGVRVRR